MSDEASKKPKFLDRLASECGVAIVVQDAFGNVAAEANNNSICRVLLASEEFSPLCGQYCGKAFELSHRAGKTIEYTCHAGLTCRAVPVEDRGQKFVAITGRTFLRTESYRRAAERAIKGDWSKFKPTEIFENILISGNREGLDKASRRLEAFSPKRSETAMAARATEVLDLPGRVETVGGGLKEREQEAADAAHWRSVLGLLMTKDYHSACRVFLEFISERFGLKSLAWFEAKQGSFMKNAALGRLSSRDIRIGIKTDDERLRKCIAEKRPFRLVERALQEAESSTQLLLFPVTVGGEIRAALGIEIRLSEFSNYLKNSVLSRIARVAQSAVPQIEILRLRYEIARRDWLTRAVSRFNESLKKIDAEDFWMQLLQVIAEILQAERASLLIKQEESDDLLAKAAIGAKTNLLAAKNIGQRISRKVLDRGKAFITDNVAKTGFGPAPADWNYRTQSFIAFPILMNERRLAVLNFADKASGDAFGSSDLELLQAIAPQIAVAIDRLALKTKAGEFEQLSVTDPLTGLLNRRYLQERLVEELNRSKRYRQPVALLMIDVDRFKAYNDNFGHLAGDEALKKVASILKENLRGADVAARFGGEEFAVLLPQTTAEEAQQIAERIRRQIERSEFPHRSVTVSIGLAGASEDIISPDDLIWAADRALYQAKERGRNNVRTFDGDADPLANNVH
jgi:diguanylate cyclase (GGDEF)-like protein